MTHAHPADSATSRRRRLERHRRRHLFLEQLEPRTLMAIAPPGADAEGMLSGHDAVCSCPVCTGLGLYQIHTVQESPAGPAESNPLSSLPQLSSNPSASAKLYLDFNGHNQGTWGSFSNAVTPVFDQDGNAGTFSNGELATIQQVWARVAEDFAPFNIDVTTIAPGTMANGVVAHIAIGGNWSDWYGSQAGGVAYIGGFYNSAPNVGYVFEAALGNGNARYVAEAASHEAGHLFGLNHQAKWNGPVLVEPYNSGNEDWAPIMGVGYYSTRTTWHNGPTSASSNSQQNDISILTNSSNGFGLRADDHGNSLATSSVLQVNGTSANASGLIHTTSDVDVFRFTTVGGALNVALNVASVGANLDAEFQLWNSQGQVIFSANPSAWLGATISTTIGAGTFYLVARSAGGYGNLGRYTISGTVPAAPQPEISVEVGGQDIPAGSAVDFGSTTPGSPVSQVFTIRNTGPGNLTLAPINAANLPAGFELVSNLGSTSLASGASTTFEIRLAAVDAGTFGGELAITNNDGDESPFVIDLAGEVAGPEVSVATGAVGIESGATALFGSTAVGTAVTRTFTVENTGTSTLTLSPLDPGTMPAGFTLVSNLGSTVLLAGESTTFVVQMDAAAAGTFSGQIVLASDDGDEATFAINLSGSAGPTVQIIDNGAAGNARVGSWAAVGNKGYQSDIHVATKGTGSKQATWTFTALPAGEYRVWATWTGGSSNASNAPFQIIYGGPSAPIVRVNQKNAAAGHTAEGGKWNFLGSANATKGWLQVKLNNSANGSVVADAIRLVYVPSGAAVTLGASEVIGASAINPMPAEAQSLAWAVMSERPESLLPLSLASSGEDEIRTAIATYQNWHPDLRSLPIVNKQPLDAISGQGLSSQDDADRFDRAIVELVDAFDTSALVSS